MLREGRFLADTPFPPILRTVAGNDGEGQSQPLTRPRGLHTLLVKPAGKPVENIVLRHGFLETRNDSPLMVQAITFFCLNIRLIGMTGYPQF